MRLNSELLQHGPEVLLYVRARAHVREDVEANKAPRRKFPLMTTPMTQQIFSLLSLLIVPVQYVDKTADMSLCSIVSCIHQLSSPVFGQGFSDFERYNNAGKSPIEIER